MQTLPCFPLSSWQKPLCVDFATEQDNYAIFMNKTISMKKEEEAQPIL
jgi:hypothetical protein